MIVNTVADVFALRRLSSRDHVIINAYRTYNAGVFHYALRYGLWALSPGGTLEIRAFSPQHWFEPKPFSFSFPFVIHLTAKFTDTLGTIREVDAKQGRIVVERLEDTGLTDRWSIGIIFSGAETELEQLRLCLAGIESQEEYATGKIEVGVCGPASSAKSLDFLSDKIHFLPFETNQQNGRGFAISEKKNFLIKALSEKRLLLLHSRIVLAKGALSEIPTKFDVGTPVVYQDRDLRSSHFCFGVIDQAVPLRSPKWFMHTNRHRKERDFLELIRYGFPYVDGGCIAINRTYVSNVLFDENLCWGEAEDLDFGRAVLQNGKLIELFPAAKAFTQRNKMPKLGVAAPASVIPGLRLGYQLATYSANFIDWTRRTKTRLND